MLDEPIGLFGADGSLSTGQIRDISLSGVAMMVDEDRPLVTEVGSYLRAYIKEVGFVPGRIVRQSSRFLALEFDLPRSLERDLLISKLFTCGLDTASAVSSAPAATIAILRSIISVRSNEMRITNDESDETPAAAIEQLGAESLVIRPSAQPQRLADIRSQRRSFAG